MDDKTKLQIIILICLFAFIALIITVVNPIKNVPVVQANIKFTEKNGTVYADQYSFTQGKVGYLQRPRDTEAKSFPAIAARVTSLRGKIGPWEAVSYNGTGNYSFNIGFSETNLPQHNDNVLISVMVVDKDGQRIGYIRDSIVWN
jgi:hypothetical protein